MMATMQDFGGLLFGMGGSGLEDYLSPQQTQGIQNQAMLQAAAALLQAGGPSARPVSLGQALGGALQAGQQGYAQAQQGAVGNLMARQKLAEGALSQARMRAYLQAIGQDTGAAPQAASGQGAMPSGSIGAVGAPSPVAPASGGIFSGLTQEQRRLLPLMNPDAAISEAFKASGQKYSQMSPDELQAMGLQPNAVVFKGPTGKPEIISRPDYQYIETPAGGKQLIDMNNPLGTVPKNVKNPTPPSAGGSGPVINTRTPPIGGTGGAPTYAGGMAPALKPEQIMSTVAAWDKDYRQPVENILASYKIVEDLATTGNAGLSDYGILIKSLKALEPNSAVMQGEADSARQMQSLADRMQGLVDRASQGGVGAEQARLDLVNLARTSANVAIDAYNRQAGRKAQLMGQFANGSVIGSVFQPFEKPSALTSKAQMEKEIKAKTIQPQAGQPIWKFIDGKPVLYINGKPVTQ
jgi:hypothetical protein